MARSRTGPRGRTAADAAVEGVVVGIDIGGTGTRVVAVNPADLTVVARTTVATPSSGTPEDVLGLLTEQINQLAVGARPLAVGIGASGPIDTEGVIRNPDTLPALTGLPLLSWIATVVDGPVVIDNDAVCAALAEQQVGAAQGSSRSLHVTLGTGVGVCLLQGEVPFRLPDGTHPEGGHICVGVPTIPCYCGRNQCWEQAASRRSLQAAAAAILDRAPTDRTVLPELAGRAEQGDSAALAVFDRYGRGVADGLGTLLTVYGPTTVVLGGSGSDYLELYRDALLDSLARLNGWIPDHQVVRTQLDDYGGAIGGARLAASALGRAGA